jgi:hypothetical protein
MARKSKYTPDLVKQLIGLLRNGNTDVDACARVGISKDTFYDWINNKPEFSDSVSHARAETRQLAVKAWRSWLKPQDVVEKSTDTFIETRIGKDGTPYEYVKTTITETVKTMAPDWKAAEAYLKRRDPENWGDRMDVTSGGEKLPIAVVKMDVSDL